MIKRTPYYSSEIKKKKQNETGHKWVPDASVWRSDKAKMPFKTFPDVLGNIFFFEKKLITGGSRPRPRHHWWCIKTPRTSPDIPEKKLKIEISDELFDVDDRLRLSSLIIVYDHRPWSSSMIIVHDHRPWSSSMIIVYDHRLRLSSKIIV